MIFVKESKYFPNKPRAFTGDQVKISFRSIRFIKEAPEGGAALGEKRGNGGWGKILPTF